MKKLFWILLLGNVVLFSVMQWGKGWWGKPVAQEQPALHAELIRLTEVPQDGVVGAVPLPSAKNSTTKSQSSDDGQVCLEWGEFSGPDLVRVVNVLSELKLGDMVSRHLVERSIGYWVYMPPLENRAAVSQKITQLKALGIDEYFVVQEAGSWRNAISLGLFKTEEAAQHFLDDLKTKGVRSARVGERASNSKFTMFRMSGISAATASHLGAMQKDFPQSELKAIPCALTR